MTLSEIRRWLKERNIHLTKSLGQNFLHDPHQLDRIVECAELSPADRVLEIGPGLGPLTERLVAQAAEVLVVEKDRRLIEVLRERFEAGQASCLSFDPSESSERAAGVSPAVHTSQNTAVPTELQNPRCIDGTGSDMILGSRVCGRSTLKETGRMPVLQIVHNDALQWLKGEPHDWSDWKVVSNLPYSVGSPILVDLCCGARAPKLMVVTLQLEVVHRLVTGPGSKDYGVLTLLVQLDFEPVHHFRIARTCFFPEPDVDSACVVLKRRDSALLPETLRPVFVRVVKRAFSQRRKMMKNLLRAEWPAEKVQAAMAHAGLAPQVRAEVVRLDQFARITRQLAGPSTDDPGQPSA